VAVLCVAVLYVRALCAAVVYAAMLGATVLYAAALCAVIFERRQALSREQPDRCSVL
jgi:hypothetical protein